MRRQGRNISFNAALLVTDFVLLLALLAELLESDQVVTRLPTSLMNSRLYCTGNMTCS
jgi:hypothetical protein